MRHSRPEEDKQTLPPRNISTNIFSYLTGFCKLKYEKHILKWKFNGIARTTVEVLYSGQDSGQGSERDSGFICPYRRCKRFVSWNMLRQKKSIGYSRKTLGVFSHDTLGMPPKLNKRIRSCHRAVVSDVTLSGVESILFLFKVCLPSDRYEHSNDPKVLKSFKGC